MIGFMKNITLLVLGIFIGVVSVIYAFGLMGGNKALNNPGDLAAVIDATPSPVISGNPKPLSVPTPVPTPGKPALTKNEVAKHSTQNDCYLIINNKVYDISNYFGSHPGGNSAMLGYCGGEASAIFSAIHSNFAWDFLSKYFIGNSAGE